jgi:serine/threonine protein kinase
MGEVFAGRYELVDPIGRGGVGAVWRAWDHRRRRYVAAKVLRQRDAHSLLRFVREQALRIDHPHVLAPTSWAADDDQVLFTMELVTGGSLVNLVNDYGPLPPAFVCTLLDQLLSGLAAVHTEHVVHRDIKPANVLLEATGAARPHLRLSDFGIAMRLGEPRLTETDYVVGTPGYLAPEQLLGAEPDFPADLFAVGLVALYLLEGAKPDTKALIEYFTDQGTPGPPKGVPESLWQVVATLLQPDPDSRFRTATGARKALASAAELLPEPGPDDELVEVFDQLGPLPESFGSDGPLGKPRGPDRGRPDTASSPTPSQGTGSSLPPAPATAPIPQRPSMPPPMPSSAPPRAGSGDGRWGYGPVSGFHGHLTGTGPQGRAPNGGLQDHRLGAHALQPATGSAHPEPTPGAVEPESAPVAVPPRPEHDPEPVRPTTMSDTGSFHLPPPQARMTGGGPVRASAREAEQHSPDTPHHRQPPKRLQHEPEQPPTHVPSPQPHLPMAPVGPESPESPESPTQAPATAVQQHAYVSTGSYTARPPQVPRRSRRTARRRPGPPAKVAVLVLLLALVCFVVGFWALAQL